MNVDNIERRIREAGVVILDCSSGAVRECLRPEHQVASAEAGLLVAHGCGDLALPIIDLSWRRVRFDAAARLVTDLVVHVVEGVRRLDDAADVRLLALYEHGGSRNEL